ncbi:MAG TPA: SHOCT domain-containing protein [Gaiellaceae bacterium]|nr:SHOCT domain-containing protein [Gaiellaceae bacterium]
MSEPVETTRAVAPPAEDETAKYASLLATDERVLLVRQRHWLTFLEAGRWFLLALGIAVVAAIVNGNVGNSGIAGALSTTLGWLFWACVVIGVLGVGWYYVVWRVERYLVTTRRVIEAGGVINKYTRDTSLQAITDMIVGHPWLGRIVGYGEIDLLTASEVGTNKIRFLPDADGFKKALLDARHELELDLGGGRVTQAASPEPTAGALSADELDASLSKLADLRDRGLITADEFEEKKKELLDRL